MNKSEITCLKRMKEYFIENAKMKTKKKGKVPKIEPFFIEDFWEGIWEDNIKTPQ